MYISCDSMILFGLFVLFLMANQEGNEWPSMFNSEPRDHKGTPRFHIQYDDVGNGPRRDGLGGQHC